MTRIGLIRHGSTEWNKIKKAQGWSDIPLDQDGMDQARQLAYRIKGENWDLMYASPLLRARQTAETISAQSGIPVLLDKRLREAGGGLIEGTTEADRISRWGEDWRNLDLGREKKEQVASRGLAFLEEILEKHSEKNILIVSHGAFIKCLLEVLVPEEDIQASMENTSVTVLRLKESWTCELFNCVRHLSADQASEF